LWKLKEFLVADNPLKSIPTELKSKGGLMILSWLNALNSGVRACNRIKLMIVGDGNVGKTSLVNCLLDKKKGKKQGTIATDGIDITNWVEPLSTAQKGEIIFNIWDFAGQEVYYATHQFFLSNRAIYLVVFNIMDENLCKVDYWLKSIHSKVIHLYL